MGGGSGVDRPVESAHAIVFDASPLIGLERVGLLETLRPLLWTAVVPDAVVAEVAPQLILPAWMAVVSPRSTVAELDNIALGRGERAALSLALELRPALIALDDRQARRMAARLGIPVVGTAGLLTAAKQAGLIATIRPYLETLVNTGFRLGPQVIESALHRAGEGPENEPRSMSLRQAMTNEDD